MNCLHLFYSGGTIFTVKGQNLDVVKVPRLIFNVAAAGNRRKRQAMQEDMQRILSEVSCTVWYV